MSNTNAKVKSSSSGAWFANRIHHNNRKTNLSDSDFKDEECLNIVEKNEKFGEMEGGAVMLDDKGAGIGSYSFNLQHMKAVLKLNDNISRSQITSKLSATNSKIKKYQQEAEKIADLIVLEEPGTEQHQKLLKKGQKKLKTLNNAKNRAALLKELRDATEKKDMKKVNKNKNRKGFIELTFSITKCPEKFRRDAQYGKDVLEVVKEFYKKLKLKADVHSYSLHLDQSSPHCHILCSYKNSDSNLNKDLENIFNKRFNLHSLQNKFNNFVREHKRLQKYKHVQELEKIERGGRWEYIKNLNDYKNKSNELNSDITNAVKEIKPDKKMGLTLKTREEKLEEQLIEIATDSALKHSISDNLVKANEKLIKENKRANNALNSYLNDAKIIDTQAQVIKDKDKSLTFYKEQQIKDRNLLEKRNKELAQLKSKYESKLKSNHRDR